VPRSVDPSRDLLFGMLTLQIGLIDQGQLVAAFQSWTRAGDRPLAEHLAARGDLDAEQRAGVEAIVALHLKKYDGDAEQSLAAVTADRSIRESLAHLVNTEVDGSIAPPCLEATLAGEDSDGKGTYTVGSVTADGQRFRILRPHAQGGLGAVFVALDTELHREVAVKQILDHHVEDAVSRARFLLEAEVTGGLEHPGIVPVYALGTDAGGRPYYAMRFIRGDSLKEAIERFHADSVLKADSGRRSLELRKLLRRFTDVCNAIDYAHNRGILHRDIKPANIIVGEYGETLVVDWGLAKPLGQVEQGVESGERPLLLSGTSGSTATLPGSAMGTPAYMSPEQAEGDLERLGARSDVYSLGGTLYSILTGRPPVLGDKVAAVLAAVRKGEFPPPRKIDPAIDKALEAICLKAMALEPEDRYGTPRALADDIELWLADAPVAAYPERPTERIGRWLRQHRTWTFAASAGLIGISMAATVAATLIEGGRRREETARKEAQNNFIMAQTAVEDYLTSVSQNTLLKYQNSVDIRSLRQDLLKTALTYYQRFVNQRNNDPNLRRQLASAYFRVGEITLEIDSRSEAIDAFQKARTIWKALAAADPANHEFAGRVADCQLAIGKQKGALGDLQGGMTSFQEARAILEPLEVRHLDPAKDQSRLADCYSEIGKIEGKLESGDQGLEILTKARTIQQDLCERYPAENSYREKLSEVITALGFVHNKRLENVDAIRCFEEAKDICQSLLDQVTAGPKPVKLLNMLALTHYNICSVHLQNRQYDKALESLEKSLAYRARLVAAHPSVTKFQENLGEAYEVIADIQHRAHRDDEAFASMRMAIDVLGKVVQSHPDEARLHRSLGRGYNGLGWLHDEQRQNRQALPAFERAVKEQELAIALSPDDSEFKALRINHLDNLGEQYVDLGEVERGLPYYREAIQMRRQLLREHPERRAYLLDLAEGLSTLGNIQRHAGDSAAARDLFSEAVTLLEQGAAVASGDGEREVKLGAALVQEACAVADLREPERARELLERAVKTLADAAVSSAGEARREWQSAALWELARVLRVLKKPAEAEKVDARRVALWHDQPAGELAALALEQTTGATLIGYGKTPIPPSALAVRRLDLDQAAGNLKLAVARGFRDLRMLQGHPDSQFLLSREDVKPLITDMSAPERPAGK
jgi:eukaryotic-like serine/threonine-protein kinase